MKVFTFIIMIIISMFLVSCAGSKKSGEHIMAKIYALDSQIVRLEISNFPAVQKEYKVTQPAIILLLRKTMELPTTKSDLVKATFEAEGDVVFSIHMSDPITNSDLVKARFRLIDKVTKYRDTTQYFRKE